MARHLYVKGNHLNDLCPVENPEKWPCEACEAIKRNAPRQEYDHMVHKCDTPEAGQ